MHGMGLGMYLGPIRAELGRSRNFSKLKIILQYTYNVKIINVDDIIIFFDFFLYLSIFRKNLDSVY